MVSNSKGVSNVKWSEKSTGDLLLHLAHGHEPVPQFFLDPPPSCIVRTGEQDVLLFIPILHDLSQRHSPHDLVVDEGPAMGPEGGVAPQVDLEGEGFQLVEGLEDTIEAFFFLEHPVQLQKVLQ